MTALAPAAAPSAPRTPWWRLDWGLVIAALGLSLVGATLVYSTTHRLGHGYLAHHLFNLVVGMVMAFGVMRLRVRTIQTLAPIVYALALLGLLAVLGPLGSTINGSRSWIELPGLSLQPAEFAKVALCVALPMVLAERGERGARPPARDVLLAGVLVAVPVALVVLQPDLGSATVLVMIGLGVVTVSGARWPWITAAFVAMAAVVWAALFTPLLSAYQRARLTAFLHPDADPGGIGYQMHQVRLAIGGGGWTGQGLLHGRATQAGVIPFQQSDFVFSAAAEELGFLGAAALIALLGFVVVRGLLIAWHTQDSFGRLVAVGVSSWFLFQILQNIGMNLAVLPVTGLPLPFVSYGGSSMFACWIGIGLLLKVHSDDAARRP